MKLRSANKLLRLALHTVFVSLLVLNLTVASGGIVHAQSNSSTNNAPSGQWRLLGFGGVGIFSIAFSPSYTNDHIIMIGGSGGVYRSSDDGLTWVPINTGGALLGGLIFSPDYANDKTMFADGPAGVYRSTDGGFSWYVAGLASETVYPVAISPNYAVDKTLFAGVNTGDNGRIFRSTDGGNTWADTGLLVSGFDVRYIAVSPNYAQDHTVFAGTGMSWNWYAGGVYRTTNDGSTWVAVDNGLLYQEISAMAISPNYANDHAVFIAPWNGGVYRTTDSGNLWVEANDGQPNRRPGALGFSPNYAIDHTVFYATWGEYSDGGVYVSTDSGVSWTVMNSGLTTRWIHRVVVSPNYRNDHVILAGGEQTNGGGLWIYDSNLPGNHPPTVNAGGPYSVNEGDTIVVTATGSDPDGEPLSFTWDLDNNGIFETPGQSVTFSAATLDGPSSQTITVKATDSSGFSTVAQTEVNIVDPLPIVHLGSNVTIVAGNHYTSTGSISDAIADPLTGTVDYGDGSGVQALTINPDDTFVLDHVYAIAGTYTLTVSAIDDPLPPSSSSLVVTVLTPTQATNNLISEVRSLVASGKLNAGQGNALIVKLQNVLKFLGQNQNKMAVNMLQAFTNQMTSLISEGVLAPADGQPLITLANLIISAIGG